MTTQDIRQIFDFLRTLKKNNNREWFKENRPSYDRAAATFAEMVKTTIGQIAQFDPAVGNVEVKQTTYRIYRDTRFSEDKTPYKTHIGAYINIHGTKSLHGGYYLHLEPGESGLGCGPYWLPTNILTAVRNDIVNRTEEFRAIVEEPTFKATYPSFGMNHLKTYPKGFDRTYPYPEYLRAKDYTLWYDLADDFFLRPDWAEQVGEKFKLMKPFMDFINETIDDYI